MKTKKFAILGGDRRMIYAAEALARVGFETVSFGLSGNARGVFPAKTLEHALEHTDNILLPIPMSRDGKTLFAPAWKDPIFIEDIFEKAPQEAQIFGGMIGAFHDKRLLDYGKRSDFAMKNAIPTAEGALLIALEKLPCMLNGTAVAVIGFGKVGKATASLFRAAGAAVTVFARRDEVCTVASQLGYSAASLMELYEYANDFRLLINTVPSPVIGDNVLCRMRKDACIIELASAPYGIDFEIAKAQGIETILAGGLPGKYSPETAGENIASTVLAMQKTHEYF